MLVRMLLKQTTRKYLFNFTFAGHGHLSLWLFRYSAAVQSALVTTTESGDVGLPTGVTPIDRTSKNSGTTRFWGALNENVAFTLIVLCGLAGLGAGLL